MPLERPDGRRRRRARAWSTPPRPPAACASTRTRSTSTTSPRRSASPPTAGCGSPRCRPRPSSASSGSPHSGRWIPAIARPRPSPSRTPARTRPTTRRRWPRCSSPSQQVEWINGNGGLEWAAGRCDRSAETHLPLGRGPRLRHAVRGRARRAQPRRRHHRPRRRRSTRTTSSPGAAGQRHRRHRVVPQAGPQPAAHRPCSRPSSPTTSTRSPAASTTSSPRSRNWPQAGGGWADETMWRLRHRLLRPPERPRSHELRRPIRSPHRG